MKESAKLTILIPCHNEEKGIGTVIDAIPVDYLKKIGITTHVLVIDNNSTDQTAAIALAKGAMVIHETKKGKGNAMITGFRHIDKDTDYVVMLDGDNTYKPKEIPRLIEPLMNDFCDVIMGSRLSGKMRKNALRFRNRVVNWSYTFLVRQFYRANTTDVLSGFFAWKREVIEKLVDHLDSRGFEIEMDMITKMKRLGYEMYSVPITYDEREGETKIHALRDGSRILLIFIRNLAWTPRPKAPLKITFTVLQQILSVFL